MTAKIFLQLSKGSATGGLLQALLFAWLWMAAANNCLAQTTVRPPSAALPAASSTSAAKPPVPAPAPAVPPPVQAIPVPDIATQAEAAQTSLRQLGRQVEIEDLLDSATDQLPLLEREATYRRREARLVERSGMSLEAIRGLEDELRDLEQRSAPLRRDLTRAAQELDRDLKELDSQDARWAATIEAATREAAPADVLNRARDIGRAVARARKAVQADQTKVLALQGRFTDVGTRLTETRQLLSAANERAVTRLIYQDSPPMWQREFWSTFLSSWSEEARDNILGQANVMSYYARAHLRDFAFHLMFFVGLAFLLMRARTRVERLSESDVELRASKTIFDIPATSALLFAMLFSTWFYPHPPRALWVAIGVLAAAPLLAFARRVVEPELYPPLQWGVVFYLVDRARALVSPYPGLHRIVLMLEALGVIVFLLSLMRSRAAAHAPNGSRPPVSRAATRWLRYGSVVALAMAIAALVSDVAGALRLADLLMRTLLGSAYTAVVLYALTRVGEGLLHAMLYMPPISYLAGVRRHRALVAARINRWMTWIAFIAWAALTLQIPGFLHQTVALLRAAWKASFHLGSLKVSISAIALFIFILWSSWLVSRLSRFLLEEEIFSRLRLDRGLPYAVSTTVHYIILLSGLVLALTAMGVDMTKFTIVAGALTVGIGFGLQNIVNNFVSGMIVLFERPVKVGDTIQIDDVVGRVRHIGIRATVIESTNGAEVIVPNGKLISDKVTNWTLSNQLRQIAVPVTTKPDINVLQLKSLLQGIALANKQAVQTPAPEVLFIKRGVDAFEFELRVWTADLDAWLQLKSDLITDINEALSRKDLPAQAHPAPAPGEAADPARPTAGLPAGPTAGPPTGPPAGPPTGPPAAAPPTGPPASPAAS